MTTTHHRFHVLYDDPDSGVEELIDALRYRSEATVLAEAVSARENLRTCVFDSTAQHGRLESEWYLGGVRCGWRNRPAYDAKKEKQETSR